MTKQRTKLKLVGLIALYLSLATSTFATANDTKPIVGADLVFAEREGLVAVEAEHFFQQSATDKRAFHLTTSQTTPSLKPDGDPSHIAGASGGAYLEILPDTRRTHADKLIRGTNFSPEPGKMAVLHYKVHFETAGRYYVWVRAYSTGSEDNGLHVGIDGTWPESGQRLQWCQGKQSWRWESKQRTAEQHCGEAHKIFLDIDEPGEHTIHFSMREDGFEFDKWLMTTNRDFLRPEGVGPASQVHAGDLPEPFPFVKPEMKFPEHWGDPPRIQTRDLRVLPGGFGRGSSTLAAWIQMNLDKDAVAAPKPANASLLMSAKSFAEGDMQNYYLDQGIWLAVDPDKHKFGAAGKTFPYPTGRYHVTLRAVGENDGRSTYQVAIDGEKLGDFECPLSDRMFDEGAKFHKTWAPVRITEGAVISVRSEIGSRDGNEFSRARWAAISFEPANNATKKRVQPFLAKQAELLKNESARQSRTDSPTTPVSDKPQILPRKPDGRGTVEVSGELKSWHNITLTLDGPYAHEQDNKPNPFTDYRMTGTFTHEDGDSFTVPGYFAADGDASNTSAESGTKWRVHFAPHRTGQWKWSIGFHRGELAAVGGEAAAEPVTPFDGKSGSFRVQPSDKQGRDLRRQGRLQYVGKHYLRFADSGKYFLKVGADAPETLLAYADFDNTITGNPKKAPIKTWGPHVDDWREGDPTWQNGKGKGLIGAINYLSGKGCNAFSFLTYNAGGDGDNVWPFIQREDKLHYDCSKLDQWATIFEHGTHKGMYLHFKMQETEIDDHVKGYTPESLDGGNLGTQRKLYCRELIARFAHNLALNWNLGEENTQTTAQQKAMIDYIAELDVYDHNIVVHTFPNQQDKVYRPLLGSNSQLTGVSLQNSSLDTTHAHTEKWVRESALAGKPWIVAFDESGSAAHAQCPDLGYRGFDGRDRTGKMVYTQHEVRKRTLWGHLMAGGAGCEYYFGYQFAENDIVCEDWRSRDQSWDYCRIAIQFFHENEIPFWEMKCMDELIGNPEHNISKFCFAKADDTYLVYLPNGGTTELDLSAATGRFQVTWFNPRDGGELQAGSVASVNGGGSVELGSAPSDPQEDWLVVLRRK